MQRPCGMLFSAVSNWLASAALAEDKTALCNESADLLYHLLVLLQCKDVALTEVIAVLKQR